MKTQRSNLYENLLFDKVLNRDNIYIQNTVKNVYQKKKKHRKKL